jgi:hypothetical protein
MQQYQDLNSILFKIRHCTCFSLLGQHQVYWDAEELLFFPHYCNQCFHICIVFKLSQCSSSFYAKRIVFFCMPLAYQVCNVRQWLCVGMWIVWLLLQHAVSFYFWSCWSVYKQYDGWKVKEWDHSTELYMLPALQWFLAWLTLQLWRWRQYDHPKHGLTFAGLQNIKLQKREFYMPVMVWK